MTRLLATRNPSSPLPKIDRYPRSQGYSTRFSPPVRTKQQRDTHGDGDAAVDCPPNLPRHETARQYVYALENPYAPHEYQDSP